MADKVNPGTEQEEIGEVAENDNKTVIEKREEDLVNSGDVEFEKEEEPSEEVVENVEPGTESEPVSEQPIVIDGTEYTTEQIKALLAKKVEPKADDKPKVDQFAELMERVRGDEELTELVGILKQNTAKLDEVSALKSELDKTRQSESAREELQKSRAAMSKKYGIELPDLDDPEVKAFFTKEIQTLDPYEIYILKKGLSPKSKNYIPPNLDDQSEAKGTRSEMTEAVEYYAKKLGAKNPKNASKNFKG